MMSWLIGLGIVVVVVWVAWVAMDSGQDEGGY